MRLQDLKQYIGDHVEENSHEGLEFELKVIGCNYFVDDIVIEFNEYDQEGDEDTNYHSHTIRENIRIVGCNVVRTDYGHEDIQAPEIEQLLIDIY